MTGQKCMRRSVVGLSSVLLSHAIFLFLFFFFLRLGSGEFVYRSRGREKGEYQPGEPDVVIDKCVLMLYLGLEKWGE